MTRCGNFPIECYRPENGGIQVPEGRVLLSIVQGARERERFSIQGK